ncbi:MAG: cysteine peptidase family C39 domain-containing protein [Candidatus Micrarchaeota archaeon]|nr:cysteine peptidase family C39 domain-containing protein [Candidatus Micrarchaeota archaeon]
MSYHHQKKIYTCGPASMRIVLDRLGIKDSEEILARMLRTNPNYGTKFKPFSLAARSLGLSYIEKKNASIRDLRGLLGQGYGIIVCYLDNTDRKNIWDHYSVVRKLDNGNIYFLDPWYGPRKKFSLRHFRRIWVSRKNRPDKIDGWLIAIRR